MAETFNILWFSEQLNFSTGFGNVSKELLTRWADAGHEINAVGWYFLGDSIPYQKHNKDDTYTQTNIMQHAGENSIGCGAAYDGEHTVAYRYMKRFKPDVVSSLTDIWFTSPLIQETTRFKTPYVNYFPIDGQNYPVAWLKLMHDSDNILAMSKWGKQQIQDEYLKAFGKKKKVDMVYHGVNIEDYYRMPEDEVMEIKKRYGWEDTFIVGFVGKHMDRKMIPELLEAFSIFHKKHKDSIMLINIGNAKTSDYGGNLERYCMQFGITKAVINLTDTISHNIGIPVEQMRKLYNLMDVHATCTAGEGFGLTTVEAQACGTPNIINEYTTATELVGGHGWLVPPMSLIRGNKGVLRAYPDIEGTAAAMEDAYNDRKKLKKYGKSAEKWTRANLNWDDLAKQYLAIMKKAQDNYKPTSIQELNKLRVCDIK